MKDSSEQGKSPKLRLEPQDNNGQDSPAGEAESEVSLLRGRLEFAQSILNSLPFNIALVNGEGDIIAINKAWRQFAEENSAPGRDFMEYNYFELCRRAASEGETSALEAREGILAVLRGEVAEYRQDYPCHSPSIRRWFRMHVARVGGNEPLVVVAHENITDQVLAQEQRLSSVIDYYPVFAHSPMPMLISEGDSDRILAVNEALLAYTEMNAVDIIGRTPVDVGLFAPEISVAIQEAFVDGRRLDNVAILCKGETRKCLLRAEPIIFDSVPCYLLRIQDVTEQVQAQQEHEALLRKYARLHESIVDGFVSVTLDGRICEFNEPYRAMLGYEYDELQALTYMDLTPARWQMIESEIVADQVLKRGYSETYEEEYRRKDGTVFPVELRSILVRDDAGNPEFIWAIVRDITERKTTELRMADISRRLDAEHEALMTKHEVLQEVLNHIAAEKQLTTYQISANIEKAVEPLIQQLQKATAENPRQRKTVDLLMKALDEISSPYLGTLSKQFASLSPRELQVCNLVKDGVQSKEIADLLDISVQTVKTIRRQIRRKLCIVDSPVSLTEYLNTLK